MFTRVGCNPRSQLRYSLGIGSPFRGGSPLSVPLQPACAREIRGILTCRCPYLPQPYRLRSTRVLSYPLDTGGNMWHGSRSLSHLREHLTARTGDGHAPPLSSSGKIFNLAFILLSLPVRFPALTPIKPQASRLVVLPRQFL